MSWASEQEAYNNQSFIISNNRHLDLYGAETNNRNLDLYGSETR